jgi:death on curing protein
MAEYLYPTVVEAMEMHRLDEFGGMHGLRDAGLLEAAIYRPQNGYHDDLIHEAAALMESLANNHAFWMAIRGSLWPSQIRFCA